MCRRLFFSISILLFLSACRFSAGVEDSRSGEHLNGKVKEVYEKSYQALEDNGVIVKGKSARKSGINLNYVQRFDEDGRLIEYAEYTEGDGNLIYKSKLEYNEAGSKIRQSAQSSNVANDTQRRFTYNAKNKLIETDVYDANDALLERFTYTYNAKDQKIVECGFRADGSLKWQYSYLYNAHGQVIEEVRDEEDGRFNFTIIYVYDRKGRLVEEISKDAQHSFDKRLVYSYDNKGRKVLDVQYNGSGELSSQRAYTYNAKGDRLSVSESFSGILQPQVTRFEYEYDRKDNWVKRVEYINERPAFWLSREIIYY